MSDLLFKLNTARANVLEESDRAIVTAHKAVNVVICSTQNEV